MLLAILGTFVLSLVFCPLIIKICKRLSLYDEVDPRKIHTGNIPRLGGIAVFASLLIVWFFVRFVFKIVVLSSYWSLFIGFAIILIFGILDDIFNMRAKLKFLMQILAALIVSVSPYHFTTFLYWKFPPFVGEILTFFWIISIVNAYNLIDGMDCVCSGISFFACFSIGFMLFKAHNGMSLIYFMLCASLLGFMYWNKPNAKIFLGDGGSQTLGYLIAVSPFFFFDNPRFNFREIPMMVLMCSIPLTDVIAAVWRRLREHRKIFSPDRAHIHHKLLNIGFSKNAAILFLLLIQAIVTLAIIISYFMKDLAAICLMAFCLIFVWVIFIIFHYLNRAVNLSHKGKLEDHPMAEH